MANNYNIPFNTIQCLQNKFTSLTFLPFKDLFCWVQVFSFVIATRCKLSESTVVNQRNRNKEWWEIRLHGLKYEHRDSKWFAFCNLITFTKRQVSHRWSPDCEYKKRWKFHASSRQRSSILILSVCHKFRVDHLHSIMD